MWTRSFAVLSLIALAAGHPLAGGSAPVPSTDEAIGHALNRLTFGPRAGDVARVKAMGLQNWIDLQLSPSRIEDAALTARLARLETLTLDSQTIQRTTRARRWWHGANDSDRIRLRRRRRLRRDRLSLRARLRTCARLAVARLNPSERRRGR